MGIDGGGMEDGGGDGDGGEGIFGGGCDADDEFFNLVRLFQTIICEIPKSKKESP